MIIDKRRSVDYSLMIMFIIFSGGPYFVNSFLMLGEFLILTMIFLLRKKNFNLLFIVFFLILFGITLLQGLKFQLYPIVTYFGLYTLVLGAYFMVKILEHKFIEYYINVLYYIAIISFVFFFPSILFSSFRSMMVYDIVPLFDTFNFAHSSKDSILIYTFNQDHPFRNSGSFWEPGAFAGYATIAFMFNYINEKKILEKKSIVLLIAIATTVSTTAYLTIFVFLFFIYSKQVKNIAFKSVTVLVIVVVAFFAFTSLDFVGGKIEERLADFGKTNILETRNSGRFVSILRDMNDLDGHEWIGRGRSDVTRYDVAPGRAVVRSNGLSDLMVRYGIIFFMIVIYFLYKSICAYLSFQNKQEKSLMICYGIFLSILLLSFSEMYFNYSIYMSLLFLQFSYNSKKEG